MRRSNEAGAPGPDTGANHETDGDEKDSLSADTALNSEEPLTLAEASIETDLDPHLQEIIIARDAGDELDNEAVLSEAADGTPLVDVIARVKDPKVPVPGLQVVMEIGDIVTGTVEVQAIEQVRRHDNILSLKSATRVLPELGFSVAEIEADAQSLQGILPNGKAVNGKGAIVGIVDFGCDFVHKNFRNSDGTTRLLHFWDQGGGPTAISPAEYGYGREFFPAAINGALSQADPYFALRYSPGASAHGTHVLDIAAGNGNATGRPGVAPGADIIFVQLAGNDFGDEQFFGNSRQLLEAVDYVFRRAAALGRPAVVNLSLGTHGGPHDGTSLVERGLDNLVQQKPGRAVVISAGNSFLHGGHARGTINPGQKRTLQWDVAQTDFTPNELEVWYSGQTPVAVVLITPGGQRLGPVTPGNTQNILGGAGQRLGRIIHRQGDPNNGDNQIDILLEPALPRGRWQIELTNTGNPGNATPVAFHAWIERDDVNQTSQSRFGPQDDDRTHTLGSISCGELSITVGSYDARVPGLNLSPFTAEGPTRSGAQKPEVSAPGQGVVAARSMTQGTTAKSGTSMAAPHVTGVVALIYQAFTEAGKPLPTIQQLRDLMIGVARHNPPAGNGWQARYGNGRVSGAGSAVSAVGVVGPQATATVIPMKDLENGSQAISDGVATAADFLGRLFSERKARISLRVEVSVEPVAEETGR